MQDARYESGLDNSPMYDGELFDDKLHHMLLLDVGKFFGLPRRISGFSCSVAFKYAANYTNHGPP